MCRKGGGSADARIGVDANTEQSLTPLGCDTSMKRFRYAPMDRASAWRMRNELCEALTLTRMLCLVSHERNLGDEYHPEREEGPERTARCLTPTTLDLHNMTERVTWLVQSALGRVDDACADAAESADRIAV